MVMVINHVDAPELKQETNLTDSLSALKWVDEHIRKLQSSGYIYATRDTVYCYNDTCQFQVFRGKKYTIKDLDISDEQQVVFEAAGLKRAPIGSPLDSTTIYSFLKTLVNHHSDYGYPFARAGLADLSFDGEGGLSAKLGINKGKKVYFDTITIEGKLDMSPSFFSRLLDVKKGKLYNHSKVIKASSKIKNLQYVDQKSTPFVRFVNDKASLVLTMDPKPSSRFDFLIGVLPQIVDGARKWTITGDMIAEMYNPLRAGEYIFFQFKKLQADDLELVVKNTVPYLFKLPVGSYLDFRIFKKGTQNLDLYFDGGTQYLFNGYNQIKFYGSYRSSSLLEIDIDKLTSTRKLPSTLDITYSGLGAGLSLRDVDYLYNPSKGYTVDITAVAGRKSIIPNRRIVDTEGFENSYDTLKLKTLQTEFNAQANYYFRIKNFAAIKTAVTTGWIYNENELKINELMRIGGNRLLRGFDEESLLTNFYGFGTFEFRLIFDQNSFMSLPFVDVGYVRVVDQDENFEVKPVFGTGIGLNFGTSAGIFNLSFAAGKLGNQPIDFSHMKIHFGYVNLF